MASEMPSQVLQGCCLSMCPPSEMTLRNREGLVHPLECRPPLPNIGLQQTTCEGASKTPAGKKGKKKSGVKGDPQYFVKEFARSSAGREIRACDVRSLPVLVRTVRYLLTDAYKREDCSASVVHEFISNRLRAVRQDLAVQGLMSSIRAAPLLAASVRYSALQLYRMCEVPPSEYNPFLDMKQLQETLACLVRLYKDHSNQPPPPPPAFSFDLDDDDEEEYFFEFDVNTGKVHDRRPNNSSGDNNCSGASSDSNRSEAQTSGNCTRTDAESGIDGQSCATVGASTENPDDSGFVGGDGVVNGNTCSSAAPSFVSYRGSDDEEVSRVMTRISAMGLEDMGGGELSADSTSRVDVHSKDDKNRFNKVVGEQVKENCESKDESVSGSSSSLCEAVNSSNELTNTEGMNINNQTSNSLNHSPPSSLEGNTNSSDKQPVCPESVSERDEMECVYLLLNYDKSEAVEHALELPSFVKEGTALSRVLPAVLAYHSAGNTTALLRLLRALPPLLSATLYLSLPKIQRKVLQVLSTGHSSTACRYPLSELAEQLLLPHADAARRACRHYGLSVVGDQLQFVSFHKADFRIDAPLMPLERSAWLDARLASSGPALLPHPLL